MKTPRTDKTRLAKALTFFVLLLLLSIGLCGVNGMLSSVVPDSVGSIVGIVGSCCAVVALFGLGVVALIGVGMMFVQAFGRRRDGK